MDNSSPRKVILIIGDAPPFATGSQKDSKHLETVIVKDRTSAISAARKHHPAIALQDMGNQSNPNEPDENFQCIQDIISECPTCKVIAITEKWDNQSALKAINMGAYDYCEKSLTPNTLNLFVDHALRIHDLESQNLHCLEQDHTLIDGVIAAAPQMLKICRAVRKIAPANLTCTILGESGTGKEVFARAIHKLSPRASNRFLAINCASVPENLIESELFGYEKGAFSGAANRTKGRIEIADKGTLFLDEIGDMPSNLQSKLLRFLQERVIERVGGRTEIPVDVRVICATNRNLENMVKEGTFREDLYYRVSEFVVSIPPLRERQGDKILLAHHFVQRYAREQGQKCISFTKDALCAIESYEWPGNVREMENRLKRAIVLAEKKSISATDLDLPGEREPHLTLREVRRQAEQGAIAKALSITQNNISAAAKLLDVTRPTLYDLMKKYRLKSYH